MSQAVVTWDPFVAMDRLDDDAIMAELEGRTIKALVYEFKQDGGTVRGLSKVGVDSVAREMAKQGEVLREMELDWAVDDDGAVLFKAKVGRYMVQTNQATGEIHEVLLDTAFGVKRQEKGYAGGRANPFWFEQGSMKAARNARMRLIREDLKQTVIQAAVNEGRVQKVEQPPAVLAPTGSKSEAVKQTAERIQEGAPEPIPFPDEPSNDDVVRMCACHPAKPRKRASGTKNGREWVGWFCPDKSCDPLFDN